MGVTGSHVTCHVVWDGKPLTGKRIKETGFVVSFLFNYNIHKWSTTMYITINVFSWSFFVWQLLIFDNASQSVNDGTIGIRRKPSSSSWKTFIIREAAPGEWEESQDKLRSSYVFPARWKCHQCLKTMQCAGAFFGGNLPVKPPRKDQQWNGGVKFPIKRNQSTWEMSEKSPMHPTVFWNL